MDFRNFMTHADERRRAGAILGSLPPVDGKRTGVHHWFTVSTPGFLSFGTFERGFLERSLVLGG